MNLKNFHAALAFAANAMSADDVRYYLRGVAIDFAHVEKRGDTTMILVGTDGSRLNRISLKVDPKDFPTLSRKGKPFILDTKAVAAILAIKKPSDQVEIDLIMGKETFGPGNDRAKTCTFVADSLTIRCDLIDGQFPDYRRVMPTIPAPVGEAVGVDSELLLASAQAYAKLGKALGRRYKKCVMTCSGETAAVRFIGDKEMMDDTMDIHSPEIALMPMR